MSKEIEALQRELNEIKAKFKFWKKVVLLCIVDISTTIWFCLMLIGIGEVNEYDTGAFMTLRLANVVILIVIFFIVAIVNFYVIFED